MGFIDRCPGCPYQGKAIGTRGNSSSAIILVGEAPGANEIEEGRPFVGPAGKRVLWPALAAADLDEGAIFITNSVACRPRNPVKPIRTPSTKAIEACHQRLVRDVELHPGAVIVALGVTAIQALTGLRGFPVTKKEPGTKLPSDWGSVLPTLHPAYVLRRGLEGLEYQMLVEDLKHARRRAFGPND